MDLGRATGKMTSLSACVLAFISLTLDVLSIELVLLLARLLPHLDSKSTGS
jgi:hypothetical protein